MRFHEKGVSFRSPAGDSNLEFNLKETFFSTFRRMERKNEDKVDYILPRKLMDSLNNVNDINSLIFMIHYKTLNVGDEMIKQSFLRVVKETDFYNYNANIKVDMSFGDETDVSHISISDDFWLIKTNSEVLNKLKLFKKKLRIEQVSLEFFRDIIKITGQFETKFDTEISTSELDKYMKDTSEFTLTNDLNAMRLDLIPLRHFLWVTKMAEGSCVKVGLDVCEERDDSQQEEFKARNDKKTYVGSVFLLSEDYLNRYTFSVERPTSVYHYKKDRKVAKNQKPLPADQRTLPQMMNREATVKRADLRRSDIENPNFVDAMADSMMEEQPDNINFEATAKKEVKVETDRLKDDKINKSKAEKDDSDGDNMMKHDLYAREENFYKDLENEEFF